MRDPGGEFRAAERDRATQQNAPLVERTATAAGKLMESVSVFAIAKKTLQA
ncbi:hypothetical protein [Paraburkholderia flava]|uniref:hypothetical protein n=1 Tax=Paraburkholderia flava TaxID=2547393 RepID=UPI0014152BF8|nr:hypothetical protein [Paraburkholderia flava]